MAPIHLRPPRHTDRARVAELLVATKAFSPEEVDVALELFDEGCEESRSLAFGSGRQGHPERSEGSAFKDYEFIAAYDQADQLLGYACFGPTPATDGTYDLYWLAVDPASQGSGVGRSLVRWVESELSTRGARLLVVETSSRPDYAGTREFYARGGYRESARIRDFYAPADDRIIFTTRLTTREAGAATR